MDKRKNYYVGLDTETCGKLKSEGGNPLVYDIGWVVCDKKGNIMLERSFVIQEIFYGLPADMNLAYYKNKLPKYREDIKQGKRQVANILLIRKILASDCREWNAKAIYMHNARFDVDALNNTIRYITKSAVRFFLPYGVEVYDTLKMARQTIVKQKSYQAYCQANGFLTKQNRPRATAEILYRYISGQKNFQEEHSGLEDVHIETKIFAHCLRQHKKMEPRLFTKPNRAPSPTCLPWIHNKEFTCQPVPNGAG